MNSKIDSQEWQILNSAISIVCATTGQASTSAALGDYSISAENWGGVSQRITIYEPQYLTKELLNDLLVALQRTRLLGAQIEVLFDFTNGGELSKDFLRGLLIVSFSGIDETIFNRMALQKYFGDWFYDV